MMGQEQQQETLTAGACRGCCSKRSDTEMAQQRKLRLGEKM